MRESNFSEQVKHPFLADDFPLQRKIYDDRLFKHVKIYENNPNLNLRIRTIDHKHMQSGSTLLFRKSLPIGIREIQNAKELIRVKAVLSEPDSNVKESNWVTQRKMPAGEVYSHNQYRVSGISKRGIKSDWVYSNIKGSDNKIILSHMLYDILDIVFSIKDGHLDYALEHLLLDVYQGIIRETAPHLFSILKQEESHHYLIKDLVSLVSLHANSSSEDEVITELGEAFLILSEELKKDFHDRFMLSPEEFSEIVKSYRLLDRYLSEEKDFLHLLIETFLEDRYERIVQKSNIEVLMKNNQRKSVLLSTAFDINIKEELISSIPIGHFNDDFVLSINSAVELILESLFSENVTYYKDESVEKLFSMLIKDLYAPLATIDRHLVILEKNLEDMYGKEVSSSVIQYTMTGEGKELSYMILHDILEATIKGDLNPKEEYHLGLIDKFLHASLDFKPMFGMDFFFEEIVKIFIDVGENFRKNYNQVFYGHSEEQKSNVQESFSYTRKRKQYSNKESVNALMKELYEKIPFTSDFHNKEKKETGILDSIISAYQVVARLENEEVQAKIAGAYKKKNLFNNKRCQENKMMESVEKTKNETNFKQNLCFEQKRIDFMSNHLLRKTNNEIYDSNFIKLFFSEMTHYFYDFNPRSLFDCLWISKKHLECFSELSDVFAMNGEDEVKFKLSNDPEKWPVGEFRLGINKLE